MKGNVALLLFSDLGMWSRRAWSDDGDRVVMEHFQAGFGTSICRLFFAPIEDEM